MHCHSLSENAMAVVNVHEGFENVSTYPPCSMGLHPWYLEDAENNWIALKNAAAFPQVVALGECGLDKLCGTDWSVQVHWFSQQISLAKALRKPLIIHCVRAFEECAALLDGAEVPIIFHGFNKNAEVAKRLLQKGFYLSYGAALFSKKDTAFFTEAPLDRVFLETDDSLRSISEIYQLAAQLRNISLETLILQLESNYQKVFEHG